MSCSIAAAFVFASFYLTHSTNAKMVQNDFVVSLNEGQRETYNKIIKERSGIYFQGLMLGLVLGLAYLFVRKERKLIDICAFASILFATSYFYYILKPKTDWILPYLNAEQSNKWLDVYKTMSYRYHLGFFIGFVGFTIMAYGSFCK